MTEINKLKKWIKELKYGEDNQCVVVRNEDDQVVSIVYDKDSIIVMNDFIELKKLKEK